jgi:hypothetical protein
VNFANVVLFGDFVDFGLIIHECLPVLGADE